MKILSNKIALIFIFAAFAVFVTTAYAKSIFDIEYPIAELGGCADKTSCKAYCDVSEHQDECENFAASYGVGNVKEKQAERDQHIELVMEDGGPGNCAVNASDPEKSCHAYCDTSEHMNECVAYGKSHGLLKGSDLEEAEKVVKALESGVALPDGCTSGESCKQMCEEPKDVSIARACFAFAEKAGLLPPNIDRAQAEKVFKLIEEGKAPFKSPKDFKQCENPASDEVMATCLKFGEENGLISPEDLEMIKKTGGKGPGGCRGKEQCDTYCSEHQDECTQFAEEHNLIAPEDKARMEEGLTRFREGIANAPTEVKQCLEGIVGREALEQMIAGRQTPNRDFGDSMQGCFEGVFGALSEQQGEGESQGIEFSEMMHPEGEGFGAPFMQGGSTSSFRGGASFMQGRPQQGKMFPLQVEECIKSKVGERELLELGTVSIDQDSNMGQAISTCMREFSGPHDQEFSQGEQSDEPHGQTMPLYFNSEQEMTTRYMQGGPYDEPRGMPYGTILPEGKMMYPPQDGTMPLYQEEMMSYDGQMPPPEVSQMQYSSILPDGVMVPPQDSMGTFDILIIPNDVEQGI